MKKVILIFVVVLISCSIVPMGLKRAKAIRQEIIEPLPEQFAAMPSQAYQDTTGDDYKLYFKRLLANLYSTLDTTGNKFVLSPFVSENRKSQKIALTEVLEQLRKNNINVYKLKGCTPRKIPLLISQGIPLIIQLTEYAHVYEQSAYDFQNHILEVDDWDIEKVRDRFLHESIKVKYVSDLIMPFGYFGLNDSIASFDCMIMYHGISVSFIPVSKLCHYIKDVFVPLDADRDTSELMQYFRIQDEYDYGKPLCLTPEFASKGRVEFTFKLDGIDSLEYVAAKKKEEALIKQKERRAFRNSNEIPLWTQGSLGNYGISDVMNSPAIQQAISRSWFANSVLP